MIKKTKRRFEQKIVEMLLLHLFFLILHFTITLYLRLPQSIPIHKKMFLKLNQDWKNPKICRKQMRCQKLMLFFPIPIFSLSLTFCLKRKFPHFNSMCTKNNFQSTAYYKKGQFKILFWMWDYLLHAILSDCKIAYSKL